MILYGASGHGKVIVELIQSKGDDIKHIVDDDLDKTEMLGIKVMSPLQLREDDKVILGIGNNQIRKRIALSISSKISEAQVHKSSVISPSANVGLGTVVMAGAIVNADTVIGEHCIVNTNATIDHDCVIHDFSHISPGATICGGVEVGEGSHIGAGAIVIPGVRIGPWSTIGAGAVVLNDIPENVVAVGTPCKPIRIAQSVTLYGDGGIGSEIKSEASNFGIRVAEIIDDKYSDNPVPKLSNVVVAVGNSRVRERIVEKLISENNLRYEFPNLIHDKAYVSLSRDITLGRGNIISCGSILTSRIEIGNHCFVNLNCTIGHDCILEDYVSLMPSVNLGGNVYLEKGVFIGTNATVLPGIRIGKGATVGAGAVVTKNVPDNSIVKGIPAK